MTSATASAKGSATVLERTLAVMTPAARPATPEVRDGYLDLLGRDRVPSTGTASNLMLSRAVPMIYERWWRPAWGWVAKGLVGPGMSGELEIAERFLDLGPGKRVLDLACGPGNFTRSFARSVAPDGLVIGFDMSETMLARAAADTEAAGLSDNLLLVRGDVDILPFVDGSFDAVCCFAALHMFGDPFGALDRMTAALGPGGRIAIFTSARTGRLALRVFEETVRPASGMRMFRRDEITGALAQRGFVDIEQRVAGLTQFVGARRGAERSPPD